MEAPALYGNLTAKENLLVHTKLLGISNEKESGGACVMFWHKLIKE